MEQRLHRAGILTVTQLWNATPFQLRRVWGGINGLLDELSLSPEALNALRSQKVPSNGNSAASDIDGQAVTGSSAVPKDRRPIVLCFWHVWPRPSFLRRQRDQDRFRHPARAAGAEFPAELVAPTDPLPVVRFNAKEKQRSLDVMGWGLIPCWSN